MRLPYRPSLHSLSTSKIFSRFHDKNPLVIDSSPSRALSMPLLPPESMYRFQKNMAKTFSSSILLACIDRFPIASIIGTFRVLSPSPKPLPTQTILTALAYAHRGFLPEPHGQHSRCLHFRHSHSTFCFIYTCQRLRLDSAGYIVFQLMFPVEAVFCLAVGRLIISLFPPLPSPLDLCLSYVRRRPIAFRTEGEAREDGARTEYRSSSRRTK